jgi:glycosyltransferase involved in cell wall biosynthesis
MKPKVSVIIPTKNEEKNIKRCLESIQSAISLPACAGRQPSTIEIIVVDNHSKDKTVELAKKYTKKVYQKGPERSAQRNYGAKKAIGQILFFVDADMEVEKNVIIQAVKFFQKDKSIKGIIVPEVSVGENYWAQVRALERSCYLNSEVEAARIFDKKAFLRTSGYDEKLIAAEDWDLNERVKKLGKIERINGKIIHREDRFSLFNHLKKKYYYGRNIRLYAQKHPERFRNQAGVTRLKIFIKNWKKLASNPVCGVGVLVLKSLEYFVFILAKLK